MSRGRLLPAAGLAAAVVVALVLLATLGGRGDDAPPPRGDVTVSTSLAPSPLFFGDLVEARVEVLVNREQLDPDTVLLEADFAPFSLVGRPQESRSHSGRTTSIDVRYTLQCLVEACLPRPGGIALPDLQVHARPSSDNGVTYKQTWPRVDVVSRVQAVALETDPPPWRQQLALPAVSYRLAPERLAAALTLAAVLLAVGAFVLVAREVVRRRRFLVDRAHFRSALARALELARASAARGPDDRRKALALLARVLAFDPNGGRRLAPVAARLAWGRAEPSTTGLETLVEEVERTVRVR
ncbi:MAG TPA: hypothetical protein VE444_06690 [Gaiellaceae bacterium]|nr:hypothetical protein [Gaiellaceae bacterium]